MGSGCSTAARDHRVDASENPSIVSKHVSRGGKNTSIFSSSESESSGHKSALGNHVNELISFTPSSDHSSPGHHANGSGGGALAAQPPKPRPPAPLPKVPTITELSVGVQQMVCGRIDTETPLENKTVYIYHCANHTDSLAERALLQVKLYPRLRELCLRRGCELVVLDPMSGLQDEFAFGHSVLPFSVHQIRGLAQSDKNVIFTVFLNEKYGVYWCPPTIQDDYFSDILKKVTEDDKRFLLQWYCHDDLSHPPCHVLQPVEKYIPKYVESSYSAYREGFREWNKQLIRLRNVLGQAASNEFHRTVCKAGIEHQLDEAVFSCQFPREQVIWLRRTFKKVDHGNAYLGSYMDFIADRLDDSAQTRLKNMSILLSDRMEAKKKIDLNVVWHENGLDPRISDHAQYLDEMTTQYEQVLTETLEVVLAKKQEGDMKRKKMVHRALTRTLYADLCQNTHMCQKLCACVVGWEELLETLERRLFSDPPPEGTVPSPLVIHGAEGSGKSTLSASLARSSSTVEGWSNSVCVMRFVGASPELDTLDLLLHSLCEQLCLLAHMPVTAVNETPRVNLQGLFNKIPPSTPLLVIIDGLDHLVDCPETKVHMAWLPLNLPQHVRVVVTATTDTLCFKALQTYVANEDCMLEVPPLSVADAVRVITDKMAAKNKALPEEVHVHLGLALQQDCTPLRMLLLSTLLSEEAAYRETSSEALFRYDIRGLVGHVFESLERRFGQPTVARVAHYVTAARFGLMDSEMGDILSCDSQVMTSAQTLTESGSPRMPSFVWCFIKDYLHPFLLERSCEGCLLVRWRHGIFPAVVHERYAAFANGIHRHLLDYFEGKFSPYGPPNNLSEKSGKGLKTKKQLSVSKKSTIGLHLVRSQNLRYGKHYNRRKLDEIPTLLCQQNMVSRLISECLFNWEWLCAKIQSSGVGRLLLDIRLAMRTNASLSLRCLQRVLQDMQPVLTQDASQFAAQMFQAYNRGRLKVPADGAEILHILEKSEAGVGPMLVRCGGEPLANGSSEAPPQEAAAPVTGLFWLKDEPNYIISVSPARGELVVWNVATREAVRTFRGLNEPKDVKMASSYKAVVLCNRELKVYNLDNGTALVTLKGVLNIRMPYFGVHDENHTIAMARNRMYVNMLDNATGEMVTTFKVGEDRFMDSLQVSDNGDFCVCGDAVQKPFPLLVWDLHNRKLVYDLRIAGHEFITKMAAISKEGHYVLCVCKEIEDPDPNFLVVYDLQSGSMFKKWKPEFSVTSVAISTLSCLVVSGHEDGSIHVWNLVSGNLNYKLTGHSRGPDRLRISDSGWHCVSFDSTTRDNSLRFWDLQEGECLANLFPENGVSCCEVSADGSTVILGLPGEPGIITFHAPGRKPRTPINCVFGDASRKGQVYDFTENKT